MLTHLDNNGRRPSKSAHPVRLVRKPSAHVLVRDTLGAMATVAAALAWGVVAALWVAS